MATSEDGGTDGGGAVVVDLTQSVGFGMSMTIKSMKLKFPRVQNVDTKTLADWLKPQSDTEVILIDSRPPEEFVISHISGSTRVDWKTDDMAAVVDSFPSLGASGTSETVDRKLAVVCYCSVGYRSSSIAQKLKTYLDAKDPTSKIPVYNLEGSLFKWANEKRPMVDSSNEKTVFAHPYSSVWGKLLDKELRKSAL